MSFYISASQVPRSVPEPQKFIPFLWNGPEFSLQHRIFPSEHELGQLIMDSFEISNSSGATMRCNGRATSNTFLMQFQADILGIPLEIPEIEETTALGSAFLGSIGLGDYDGVEDLAQTWRCARCYEPKMSSDQRGSLLYHWHRAMERAKYWSED